MIRFFLNLRNHDVIALSTEHNSTHRGVVVHAGVHSMPGNCVADVPYSLHLSLRELTGSEILTSIPKSRSGLGLYQSKRTGAIAMFIYAHKAVVVDPGKSTYQVGSKLINLNVTTPNWKPFKPQVRAAPTTTGPNPVVYARNRKSGSVVRFTHLNSGMVMEHPDPAKVGGATLTRFPYPDNTHWEVLPNYDHGITTQFPGVYRNRRTGTVVNFDTPTKGMVLECPRNPGYKGCSFSQDHWAEHMWVPVIQPISVPAPVPESVPVKANSTPKVIRVQKEPAARTPAMTEMFMRTGEKSSWDPLVSLLYHIMRDRVPCGEMEQILQDRVLVPEKEAQYCNGFLAGYAEDIAQRLRAAATK